MPSKERTSIRALPGQGSLRDAEFKHLSVQVSFPLQGPGHCPGPVKQSGEVSHPHDKASSPVSALPAGDIVPHVGVCI